MTEQAPDYVTEAMELLQGTSVEIQPARTAIVRENGEFREVEKPAFVKISTSFKSELPNISGDALKVWIFISLSINRKTARANPGLRTIAAGVKLAINTVQKCLTELEAANLLAVNRESARYNIYEIPEYVSANRADPTVSNGDTPLETVSNSRSTVSNFDETVSPSVILNQRNQSQPKINKEDAESISKRTATLTKLYWDNIGAPTPLMADILRNAAIDYPEESWYEPAFTAAVKANARKWNFVEAVLKGWKENGFGWKPEKYEAKPSAKPNPAPQPSRGMPTFKDGVVVE